MHQRGVEIAAGVLGEMTLEVIGDFVFAFHAEVRFGVARLAAAFLLRCALQNGDRGAALQGRDGGSHPAHTATRDYDIRCAAGHDVLLLHARARQWWVVLDSNQRPRDYESPALTD